MNGASSTPGPDLTDLDDQEPVVGSEPRPRNLALVVACFGLLALVLFVWLNARRAHRADLELTPRAAAAQLSEEPPPLASPAPAIGPNGAGAFSGLPTQVAYVAPPIAPSHGVSLADAVTPTQGLAAAQITAQASSLAQRRRAPALVVDIGGAGDERRLAQLDTRTVATPSAAAVSAAAAAPSQGSRLNDTEQFAQRVGDEATEQVRATAMRNPGRLVPQGAMIPGVLETAINSDLPGYTRAVVSRDVLSFDGKAVLIPRGSRLIGQYKNAVALGQSRAFIIWTRVIRPDGVSVQIGSPGTDDLGRGGLAGEVNRHFFRRFSGSILLSVLNAGVAAIGQQPSTQISIGSPAAAAGLANSATQGDNISPTIKVAQGEAIRIFVSRDLDFSGVDAVR